ncbi:MAG: DMT family transporter [Bacteroidales bacterium]|nr:DMT family transporter [Bacteroidales bacterium]
MWVLLALSSAFFLGLYDIFKKSSLDNNNVLMVLGLTTLFCSLIFLPTIILSHQGVIREGSLIYVNDGTLQDHLHVLIKAGLVLSSWILSYYGLKYLPITIVGPINATRPVIVLIGALTVFAERLYIYQWRGVIIAIISFTLLSLSGRKEAIIFSRNSWIYCCIAGTILGAISGLYDKWLLKDLSPMFVQSWFLLYQFIIMGIILLIMHKNQKEESSPFKWRWTILMIAISLSIADFLYFYSLSIEDSMISIVSMLRRCSVVVSFVFGAYMLKEKNIKDKAIDLALVILGLVFLLIGSLN